MSTLKVDTIQPNASSGVSLNTNATVTGTSTLQGNVAAQANLTVTGTVDCSSTLDAAKITLNNATPGGTGSVTGVSTIECANATATGVVTAGTLSVSGGAAVGSLTIGGDPYDQRVPVHCTIEFDADVTGVGWTGSPSSGAGITLRNNRGVSSAEWIAGVGSARYVQVTLNESLTRPRFATLIQGVNDAYTGGIDISFSYDSNTRVLLKNAGATVRYIQIAMFG